MADIDDRPVSVVTGANSGLGRAAALRLADLGAETGALGGEP